MKVFMVVCAERSGAALWRQFQRVRLPYTTHMKKIQQNYFNPDKFKQIVWDYNISPADFFEILNGKKEVGRFNRAWAVSRVLENVNYYDAISLVPLSFIEKHWEEVKKKMFHLDIIRGYEFVLQKHALSSAR